MAQEQSLSSKNEPRVRIIGVGGAGCNAVEHIARTDLGRLPLAVVHTHARVLQHQTLPTKLLIGANRTHGLGTGGDADLARVMAEEAAGDFIELVQDTDLLFILAGLGGGTGTGATPVVAKVAKQSGALVIAVVMFPFDFEGTKRSRQAQIGLQNLRSVADAVICIPNQKICGLVEGDATIVQAFTQANDLLAQGLCGLWQMLTRPGMINVDFGYLHSVLRGRHTESVLASVSAVGEDRASRVADLLLGSPLLNGGQVLAQAEQVLVSLVGPESLTVAEITRITDALRRQIETEDFVIGTAVDNSVGDKLCLTMIASKGGKMQGQAVIEDKVELTPQGNPMIDSSFLEESATPRPAPRFVAPPPDTTPEKTRELLDRKPAGRLLKTATKWKQELLALEIVSRGRFEKSEPTIHRGADLDVPTYVRRGMPLN